MNIHFLLLLTITCSIWSSCQSQKQLTNSTNINAPVAFPGAEGFGKFTVGGRGGQVRTVSNLNDNGPGSLRAALQGEAAKIIVFSVSGTIHLLSPLQIKSNTTIAGQTAPGDGICVADHSTSLSGDNIIVRYMRFRMGDRYQNAGMVDRAGSDDAFGGGMKRKNIIVDHCSLSWSEDEVFSVYGGDSTTLQWNLIAEPLNYSYHFEAGDKDFEQHGFGGILGGRHISIHHNLYAHCRSRTPRFDGNRNIKPFTELADFTNNVIYNWGINNVYAGEGGNYNITNNYYKPGPNTSASSSRHIANPYKRDPDLPFGKWFINGNFLEGSSTVTADNWTGVVLEKGNATDLVNVKRTSPFEVINVATQSAKQAYDLVLANVGASYRRDTLDSRIIMNVKNSTGRIIDVQGGFPHGTPYEISKIAWPELKTGNVPVDKDADGMPDEWEIKNGLNPSTKEDASINSLDKHYTNIEVYINSLTSDR